MRIVRRGAAGRPAQAAALALSVLLLVPAAASGRRFDPSRGLPVEREG